MSKTCFVIIFIALWIMIGFIYIVFVYAYDVRGKEYNSNYFDGEIKYIILYSLGGCMTLILTIVAFIIAWIDEHKLKSRPFTKFIYWLGNIGVKIDKENK